MPARNGFDHGVPGWVDIGTDVEGAKAFYTGLFGWGTEDAGPAEETGGYGFFTKGGNMVAGYGPQQNPGPPFWSTYVIVDDADDVVRRVESAGGTVVMPVMDVMDQGRMAIFQDPQGAFISVWQSGQHRGAQVVNEPGSLCWNELHVRDVDAARRFYPAVFGWQPEASEGPMPYTEWKLGGRSVGGMMAISDQMPAEVPSYWLVYFAVDDVERAAGDITRLGGSLQVPRMDTPAGPVAVASDPQGAAFAVIQLLDPDE